MSDILPIPPLSHKRSGRLQDAARLYVHQRITDCVKLAQMVGYSNVAHLREVKREDKWDDFVAQLASRTMVSVWGEGSVMASLHAEDWELVKSERKQQVEMIPRLEAQREKLLAALPMLEVGSKAYVGAMGSLRHVTAMLADFTGLERWVSWVEFQAKESYKQKDRPPPKMDDTKVARGTVVDLH